MLNSVIETGRLVTTPELKHSTNQNKTIAYTKFRIAVDRDYKQEGKNRITDFFDVLCWYGTAEFACKFQKGQLITIQGKLQAHSYTDTNKEKHNFIEIVADNIYYAEQRKDSANDQNTQ